jgi:hypothetical protein
MREPKTIELAKPDDNQPTASPVASDNARHCAHGNGESDGCYLGISCESISGLPLTTVVVRSRVVYRSLLMRTLYVSGRHSENPKYARSSEWTQLAEEQRRRNTEVECRLHTAEVPLQSRAPDGLRHAPPSR